MRFMTVSIAVVIAGCAGTPTAPGLAPIAAAQPAIAAQPSVTQAGAAQTSATQAAAVQTSAAPTGPQAGGAADTQRVAHAKLGLKAVTVNGEVLYCRTERKTGSHLATETSCFTEQQLDDLHEQTRQGMEQIQRPSLPKSAK
jgi:hypothetical protein